MQPKSISNVRTMVLVGVLAALVFALSSLEIPIPLAGDNTRIHFGNIMCLLSGVLFGPMVGGLAAGIGSMIYDLTHPLYTSEFWITFIMKFAMGFVAGFVAKYLPVSVKMFPRTLLAALSGQVLYFVLYLGKTAIMQHFVMGLVWPAAMAIVGAKAIVSGINGLLAVVCCTLLAPPLRTALDNAGLFPLQRKGRKP